jgi:hypothetical protein
MSDESMWQAVHRMDAAAERMDQAADRTNEATQRMAYMLESGYGGNGLRLIELLESAPAPAVVMPERKPQRITDDYARGWNDYAVEFARLNEVQYSPPALLSLREAIADKRARVNAFLYERQDKLLLDMLAGIPSNKEGE